MLQLNPPLPVMTPKGRGLAWFLIDYGVEHNLMYSVALDENGEVWTFQNTEIRAIKNLTMGRNYK